jgi:hypothetical protein
VIIVRKVVENFVYEFLGESILRELDGLERVPSEVNGDLLRGKRKQEGHSFGTHIIQLAPVYKASVRATEISGAFGSAKFDAKPAIA